MTNYDLLDNNCNNFSAEVSTEITEMQRFRGGLVFKAHRLLYHSTLGLRVIKKKKKKTRSWKWVRLFCGTHPSPFGVNMTF